MVILKVAVTFILKVVVNFISGVSSMGGPYKID